MGFRQETIPRCRVLFIDNHVDSLASREPLDDRYGPSLAKWPSESKDGKSVKKRKNMIMVALKMRLKFACIGKASPFYNLRSLSMTSGCNLM
jgi:hypothetical protein